MSRRTIRLADLDAVVREAQALHTQGYTRGGTWSLGQMCDHLAQTIERSMDGFPAKLPAPVRWLITWLYWKKVERHEPMKRKVDAPKWLAPPPAVEDPVGLARLQAAVARFNAHPAALHPSPVFGRLTKEQWHECHVWH